jgi:hypothetical protein
MKRYLHRLRKQLSPAKGPEPQRVPFRLVGLLLETWQTVVRFRSLWWLGIIAGLSQGYGINPQLTAQFDDRLHPSVWQPQLVTMAQQHILLVTVLVLFLLALWLLSVIAEAGLMKAVMSAAGGENMRLGQGLSAGRPYLWRLIKLNLTLALLSLVIALAIGLPALQLLVAAPGLGLVTGWIGIVVFLIFAAILALLYPWMARYVVLEDRGTWRAIRSAWRLFRRIPQTLLSIGIAGLVLQLAVGLAVFLTVFVGVIPLLSLVRLATPEIAALVGGVLFVLMIGIVAFLLAGVMTALKNTYYTLAFRKLSHHG